MSKIEAVIGKCTCGGRIYMTGVVTREISDGMEIEINWQCENCNKRLPNDKEERE